LDPADTGAARGWARGGFGGRPVAVPYVPNARTLTSRSFAGSVAWYERDLRVHRSGRYVVRFESVNHRATVWLDGRRVGAHTGTYLPFEIPITLDDRRAHRLVVRADWRDPERMKAGDGAAGSRAAIGRRELTWAAGQLRLNGRPLRLRGASLQEDARGRGDALRPADQATLARELVGLGANATRCQHPLDPGLLERLDAAGVLVWMGVGPVDSPGSWTSRTAHRRRIARQRTMAAVREAQPHPSVIAYNLANELAGNGHDATQVAYLRRMAREVRARDPGRLV